MSSPSNVSRLKELVRDHRSGSLPAALRRKPPSSSGASTASSESFKRSPAPRRSLFSKAFSGGQSTSASVGGGSPPSPSSLRSPRSPLSSPHSGRRGSLLHLLRRGRSSSKHMTGLAEDSTDWVTIKNEIIRLFESSRLEGDLDTLCSQVAQLAAETPFVPVFLCDALTQGAGHMQKQLADASTTQMLPLLIVWWDRFSRTILPYLEGMFLSLNEQLEQEAMQEQRSGPVPSVRSLCMAAFRDVLCSDEISYPFTQAVHATTELPAQVVQMVTTLANLDTGDHSQLHFRENFVTIVEARMDRFAGRFAEMDRDRERSVTVA